MRGFCGICIFLVISVFLQGALSQIVFDDSNTRIVGGSPIQITQAPYQIALTLRVDEDAYSFKCGGSLITPSLVVTAGHCLIIGTTMINSSLIRIFAGITYLNQSDPFFSDAEWTKIHGEYYESRIEVHNDIGLVKLKSAFTLSNSIKIIPLSAVITNESTNCSISGWGYTGMTAASISLELRRATVSILNKQTCSNSYEELFGPPLHNGTICAGLPDGGVDSCQGDSGGPLVCNGLLTGIVSYGNGCGLQNYPGIYTEVRQYKQWVEQNGANSLSSVFVLLLFIQIFLYVVLK